MAPRFATVGVHVERNAVAAVVQRRVGRYAAGTGNGFGNRPVRKFRQSALRQPFRSAGGERISRPCRSEEHTSELQSLLRSSYAAFCSKKKKHMNITTYHFSHD